jgi:CHAT domain-containing protein
MPELALDIDQTRQLVIAVAMLENELSSLAADSITMHGDEGDMLTLNWLVEERSVMARRGRLFAHPRLLVPNVIEALHDTLPRRTHETDAVLEFARAERDAVAEDPRTWPAGMGPIERLMGRVQSLRSSEAQVLVRASAPLVTSMMSMPYVVRMGRKAFSEAKIDRTVGITHARLVLAATKTGFATDDEMFIQAEIDFVDVVKWVLKEWPTGPLLAEARAIGDDALSRARATGNVPLVADVLFSIGTMYLDPYSAEKQVNDYQVVIRHWLQLEGPPRPGQVRMPPPPEALQLAASFLSECCSLATGRKRGFAYKAFAQALTFSGVFTGRRDSAAITQLLEVALSELDPSIDVYDYTIIRQTLRELSNKDRYGTEVGLDSPSELERRFGSSSAATIVRAEVARLASSDIEHALALMKETAPIRRRASEALRVEGCKDELRLVLGLQSDEPDLLTPSDARLQDRAEVLFASALREKWDLIKTGILTIGLAVSSMRSDEEAEGVRLLDRARSVAPSLFEDHHECMEYLYAQLLIGAGVNRVHNGEWQAANDYYSMAIKNALKLDLRDLSFQLLERIADVVRHGTVEVSVALADQLSAQSSLLEARIGENATHMLQDAYKDAVCVCVRETSSHQSLFDLMQLAKGRRFAGALSSGSRYSPLLDSGGARILGAIEEMRQPLHSKRATAKEGEGEALREEVLVATYADMPSQELPTLDEGLEGTFAHLSDLERRFDSYVLEQVLLAGGGESATLSTERAQALLDPETLLLNLYVGRGAGGNMVVYILALTADGARVSVVPHDTPEREVYLDGTSTRLRTSPLGVRIARLRRNIQEPPLGQRSVGRFAEKELEQLMAGLLGEIGSELDGYFNAGKRHLCLVPHGPLHYLPAHLLGPISRPLAVDWTVTYLPNIRLLAPDRGDPTMHPRRATPIASFGLGFAKGGSKSSLPPIAGAVHEAQEVAALFGEKALTDAEVTASSVLEGLQSARMVHIATHGHYDAFAPAFQSLQLSPTADWRGEFCAYQLLGLDLRGIELVSLSACQTALGRFDAGDNLRGLPAALLLAGVAAVVGTMWPVRDIVARFFFVQLYAGLADGAGRLEAFRTAQAGAREAFPRYRDWGCFYYTGEWRG